MSECIDALRALAGLLAERGVYDAEVERYLRRLRKCISSAPRVERLGVELLTLRVSGARHRAEESIKHGEAPARDLYLPGRLAAAILGERAYTTEKATVEAEVLRVGDRLYLAIPLAAGHQAQRKPLLLDQAA